MKKRKKKIENQKIRIIIITRKRNKNKPNKPEKVETDQNRRQNRRKKITKAK